METGGVFSGRVSICVFSRLILNLDSCPNMIDNIDYHMKKQIFTLTEVARILGVSQHTLIYLCEKGIIAPKFQQGTGRGSSRKFSRYNLFEIALVLHLRNLSQPSSVAILLLKALATTTVKLRGLIADFSLPDSLGDDAKTDIRIILAKGKTMFFALGQQGKPLKLLGGINLKGKSPRQVKRLNAPAGRPLPSAGRRAADTVGWRSACQIFVINCGKKSLILSKIWNLCLL